ncbi:MULTISPECIES: hypothetical protein [unclassified Flavobacterium]|jgi:heme/copper-type cytochrome/quinol oxidase subunit 2|uniref:hypothetical protein n=1 Tax=unclassified Flavobacterium TaxID=196869 RepID=UPI0025BFA188|nr:MULTISPECIES: hypothetical protein [unclassified Flavobacterium]
MFSKENRVERIEKRRIGLRVYFYILCSILYSLSSNAQCAMCRAALGGEANKAQAQAVNDGIVYLMVIPYLLMGVLGYVIYRMWKKKSA